MPDPMADVAPLPAESTAQLNQRESYDYREYRRQVLWWLLNFGKDPVRGEGYAEATVRARAYLIDQFYRWVWQREGTYTTWVSHEHANDWVDELVASDKGNATKNNSMKAVRTLFKYQHHIHGTDEWLPPFRFHEKGNQPRDYLTKTERRRIRDPRTYEPTDRMIDRSARSRDEVYREAARLMTSYREIRSGKQAAIRRLLDHRDHPGRRDAPRVVRPIQVHRDD